MVGWFYNYILDKSFVIKCHAVAKRNFDVYFGLRFASFFNYD